MASLLVGLLLIVAGACGALAFPRHADRIALAGLLPGCAAVTLAMIQVLLWGAPAQFAMAWTLPVGSLCLGLDPLSAFFLVPLLILCATAGVYGAGYLADRRGKPGIAGAWCCYNLLAASMVLILAAADGVVFLMAWEVMAISSFFLVVLDDEPATLAGGNGAGWIFIIAAHLGGACLLAMFTILAHGSGSFNFAGMTAHPPWPAGAATLTFLLAVLGFGSKAGLMPLHVWLPEAHPAAPSFVSAVMSGVMIQMGIYGLLRTLTFLGAPPAWWGWLLVGIGLVSGLLGALLATAQDDLKRLLAYSSIENVGLITTGLGLGLIGLSAGDTALTFLGFAGALLHVLNHAFAKALLFLGAGAVKHATGTTHLDRLGGLLKTMPATGILFIVGVVSLTALPPFNGFLSEFLLFRAALSGVASADGMQAVPPLAVTAALGVIATLAVAAFAKAAGVMLLGTPRQSLTAVPHDPPATMRLAMMLLAVCGLAVALLIPDVLAGIAAAVGVVTGWDPATVVVTAVEPTHALQATAWIGFALLALILGLIGLRRALLKGRSVTRAATWGCGYAAPTPRMQYTGTSFVQPLISQFERLLQIRRRATLPRGYFPRRSALALEVPDVVRDRLYEPLFGLFGRALGAMRWLQHGRTQLYVLYIAVTLVAAILWGVAR